MGVSWTEKAACARPGMNPEWWFPLNLRDLTKAIDICTTCPVLRDCAQDVINRDAADRSCVRGGVFNTTSHSASKKKEILEELQRIVQGGLPRIPKNKMPA